MEKKYYRDESRKNWSVANVGGGNPTESQIQLGAILRIADALELMAKRYQDMLADIENLKRSRDYWHDEAQAPKRTAAGLRGVITKQRAIIEELGQRAR